MRDLYSGARAGRELSLMGAIMALAPVGAPMIGGVLQSAFGWRSHFVLQIAFGLIAACFVWRKLPETLAGADTGAVLARARSSPATREIMRNRAVLAYVGMLSVSFAGVFAWISGSSLRAAGDLWPLGAGLRARLRGGERRLSRRHRARDPHRHAHRARPHHRLRLRSRSRSAALGAAAVVPLGGASPIPLIAAMAIYAVGMGLAQPQTIAGAMMPFPDRAGTASSLVGVVADGLRGDRPASIVGHLLGTSAWPVAIPLALSGVLDAC